MSISSGAGLARVVIVAPKRRLDVAFPEQLPLASLLPGVLRQAGEDLADRGLDHEGWVLRRVDGAALDPGSSLAAAGVLDGEMLHLTPRRTDWPETTYDDIVEVIASGARRRGRRWSGAATRATGLATGGVALTVGLVNLALAGPPWTVPASLALGVAVALLLAGTALSRALGNAGVGGVVGAGALPFAALAGVLFFADDPLPRLGAPHVLAGSALLTASGILGYLGTAEHGRLFVAGILTGVAGVVGAGIAFTSYDAPEAAGLLCAAALLASPLLPAMSVRIGRIALPDLPRTPDDLARDDPLPDRRSVLAATARADETLTGLLFGSALVTGGCVVILIRSAETSTVLLAAVVSFAFLLRARFYVAVRHRTPLLATGVIGAAALGVAPVLATGPDRALMVVPLALVVTVIAVAAGLVYSRRLVAPRLGRFADVLDVLLTLAVVPLLCAVIGLFTFMRGMFG
jgi:type VII secretion integral membrane protein EccD